MASGTIQTHSWKLVNTVTGQTSVALPSGYEDVYVKVAYSSGSRAIPFTFHYRSLASSAVTYIGGYESIYCQVNASTASVNLVYLATSGTDITSTAEVSVYVR